MKSTLHREKKIQMRKKPAPQIFNEVPINDEKKIAEDEPLLIRFFSSW